MITANTARVGNFTSSEIYKLMSKDRTGEGFGAPAMAYIKEKALERRLGRSLDVEMNTRALAWGKFLEERVNNLLGLEYKLQSGVTLIHKGYPCWAGSPDFIVEGVKVAEAKCYYPAKFAAYTDALLTKDINHIKKEFPAEYWQVVSNAAILDYWQGEAITYMPYESELQEIRDMAYEYQGERPWEYRFIYEDPKEYLPYLPDGGYYKNLNIFTFEIPEEDVAILSEKVRQANKLADWRF